MKKLCFFFFISFLLFSSCDEKEDIQREVFLGMKLGSTINEAQNHIQELVKQNILDVYSSRFPYFLNTTSNTKNYFSAPLYFSIPGDTIVNEIKVVYCDNLDYLEETVKYGVKGWDYMNLHTLPKNLLLLSANEIWEDISLNLERKYGKYNEETINDYDQNVVKIRYWRDKKDVNIELNFLEDTNDRGNENLGGNSRI